MRQFFFAVAVVALSATASLAQQPAASPPPASTPVIIGTTGTPYAEFAPAQSQRRGLFGRLRNRNNTSTYTTTPMMTVPMSATPMPPVAPQPMPMPGTKTDGSVKNPTPGIVTASGNLPPGTYTTTDGTIIQIGGSTSGGVMTADYTEPTTTRRGLFGRIRNR